MIDGHEQRLLARADISKKLEIFNLLVWKKGTDYQYMSLFLEVFALSALALASIRSNSSRLFGIGKNLYLVELPRFTFGVLGPFGFIELDGFSGLTFPNCSLFSIKATFLLFR